MTTQKEKENEVHDHFLSDFSGLGNHQDQETDLEKESGKDAG